MMFKNIESKIKLRDLYEKDKERLLEKCNRKIIEIDKNIDLLDIDDSLERKYMLGMYAKENFRKCKDMSIEDAFLYADNLFKEEDGKDV